MKRRCAVLCSGVLLLAAVAPCRAADFSDRAVEAAIAKGIKYLWSIQKADGSWPMKSHPHEKDAVGWSSLAAYALLESGVSVQHPKMQKALDYLTKNDTDRVYALGVRCNVWLAAERERPGEYFKYLRHDGGRLIQSLYKGGHHYILGDKHAHNSSAQYGVLGVWGYRRAGGEVPLGFWRACTEYWVKGQQADGGWGYEVTWIRDQKNYNRATTQGAMVPAGVASLFICFDNLSASKFIDCKGGDLPKPIQRGLDWFDKNFVKSLQGKVPIGWKDQYHYYLYGVERVALASGYKYFGKVSWYKEGAKFILGRQAGDGSFTGGHSSLPSTAFALLFLIRGRHPVAFNKLEFQGDWNNRPRDLAFLTRWMSRTFERSLNWQIVNLQVDVQEWHDAPILYISGSKAPTFSNADLDKLRHYVYQGGTILSATECNGTGFKEGIREAYRKLFPHAELTPIGKDHDLYSDDVYQTIPETVRFEIISNGVRPLVIHTDVDLPMQWQTARAKTGAFAFHAGTNALMYVTDKGKLPHRGTSHWPARVSTGGLRTVKVARIKHNGNDNAEPLAYERFARLMAAQCKVNVQIGVPIDHGQLAKSGAKLAILSGTNDFTFSAPAVRTLKSFVDGGGTLLLDAAGGVKYTTVHGMPKVTGFAEGAEKLINQMYPDSIRLLSQSSNVYSLKGKELREVTYRARTRRRLGGSKQPVLRGVLVGNRPGIIYSREDISHGLLGVPHFAVDGYAPESAFAILRNIVLTAGK